ncbi:precorrin-6A reductase [Faecalicatena contorta]|uniref:precorrin-6A reductase n=2 Tax=Faecalicatena contorta TaxID=39482 RepID=UPI00129E79A1|nr:precorrin-6A reductase [Faecalicatena contorta]MEE0203288.1 precorrin-6A reductase [Muricomes sp.]MRM89146.1 precorrin-6A reductase [Faecalicatena contorta]
MENGRMIILLFAGTSEGRMLAEFLGTLSAPAFVSTATEYGMECVEGIQNIRVITGRMDEEAICGFIRENQIRLVIDATHPFARLATENIQNACKGSGAGYIRCLRDESRTGGAGSYRNIVIVNSVAEAVEYLKTREGRIFISTGSKELRLYTAIDHYKERCFARVLSTKESVEESVELGFKGSHLIAMQGPFSKELNTAMLKYTGADYFVTKESGKAGGFEEKLEAARETGVTLVVIGRPAETGYSVEEIKEYIQNILNTEGKGVRPLFRGV